MFDSVREFGKTGGTCTVQADEKGVGHDKSYDRETQYWEMDGLTMADLAGNQTYRITDMSPVLGKKGVRDFFDANRAAFELNAFATLFDSAFEDSAVSEDVAAGSLLGRWASDTLPVDGGGGYALNKNRKERRRVGKE